MHFLIRIKTNIDRYDFVCYIFLKGKERKIVYEKDFSFIYGCIDRVRNVG